MSVLHDEIFEQPACIRQFLDQEAGAVNAIGQALKERPFDYIFIAARGTSDNAARYGQYLFGTANRLPVALAGPSLFTVYAMPPVLNRALIIGISQSGQSPDIVSVVEEGRRQGAPTVAITNDPESPLAKTAEYHIHLEVGKERSVAATKTYTAELAAVALLSISLAGQTEHLNLLRAVPDYMQSVLESEPQAEAAAQWLKDFNRAVVIGRGVNFSTTCEVALKIKELSYVGAEPYSSADFKHGPMALVDETLPVIMVSAGEAFCSELSEMARQLREQGARLTLLSDRPKTHPDDLYIPLPAGMPEWLTPLVAILPGQLLAFHLSRARGYDPDQPRSIRKVTRTY
ncbi:MAG: SIS domain-containing protein [Chloroflexi bacterium]|nr:SIS domain-containing protein [Chloroflexota bacterium]